MTTTNTIKIAMVDYINIESQFFLTSFMTIVMMKYSQRLVIPYLRIQNAQRV
jgi:hypothetical protein